MDVDLDQLADGELRRLARELLPRSEVIAGQVTEHVVRVVPELAPSGTADAVRVVRRLTAGGGDVTHLLRAYRVGHDLLWRIWTDHVETELRDDLAEQRGPLLSAVLRASSQHLFDFIDAACHRIVEDFPTTLTPGAYGGPAAMLGGRAAAVRAVLGSDPIDLQATSAALGYDLDRVHLALVASPVAESASVRHELERVIDRAETGGLTLLAGDGTWWGWLVWARWPSEEELGHLTATVLDGVLIGMGAPGRGREGFRTSHAQGREAERVARMRHEPQAGITDFRRIELASLLCADPERARRFAAERLGHLAEPGEIHERLRVTLRSVLRHGHNRADAAKELDVHHKTVTYRINQAERLLGRPLAVSTADLDAALTIHSVFYGP